MTQVVSTVPTGFTADPGETFNWTQTFDNAILVGVWSTPIVVSAGSNYTATPGTGGTIEVQYSRDGGVTYRDVDGSPFSKVQTSGVDPAATHIRCSANVATGTLNVRVPGTHVNLIQNPDGTFSGPYGNSTPGAGSFATLSDKATANIPSINSYVAPLISPSFSGTITLGGSIVETANAMAGTQIDVTQPLNTVAITANTIYSIIGGHTAGRFSQVRFTNSTSTDWTATLPSGMYSQAQGSVTTPIVTVKANNQTLLGIGDDGTTYAVFGDSASIYTYEGTWGSRPTTGISAGALARMTSGIASAVDVICKWSTANTDWVPVGPVCLFQLTSDVTVTESGSGAAEALLAGTGVTIPVGLLKPGGHIDFTYVGEGALNTNNKTFRQRLNTSTTISGSNQLSGQNHASAATNGLSGGAQLEVLATNKIVSGHTNALDTYGNPQGIVDITSIDNSTTAIVLFMTSQLAASASSMTLHSMKIAYTPGMN